MPFHRYVALNLKQNPFGELDFDDAVRLADVDLDPIFKALDQGLSVQLVGRHGRGKTTTLRVLSQMRPGCVYERIWSRDFTGQWPAKPPVLDDGIGLLALDEADALLPHTRIKLMRKVPQVVLATHRSLRLSMRLAGHQVHTITVGGTKSTAWLHRVLNQRIAYFRMQPGPVFQLTEDQVAQLQSEHGDYLRGMERALYDQIQDMTRR